MRLVALAALFFVASTLPAAASRDDDNQTGGKVVDGTPVAIAVRGGDGSLVSWGRPSGGGPRWTCAHHALDVASSLYEVLVVEEAPTAPIAHRMYVLRCHDQDGALVHQRSVYYDPSDPLGGLMAGERSAELAREELEVPAPPLVLSPPDDQVVGLPTWLAVDVPWEPTSASASVSDVTATVVATPASVVWALGDGTTVSCAGPGARFDPSRPAAEQRSGCTHTFISPSGTRPSGSEPGGTYRVEATVSYDVSWSATDGSSGFLEPITRTSSRPLRVIEVQAMVL